MRSFGFDQDSIQIAVVRKAIQVQLRRDGFAAANSRQ
jgi:hypothetical protein